MQASLLLEGGEQGPIVVGLERGGVGFDGAGSLLHQAHELSVQRSGARVLDDDPRGADAVGLRAGEHQRAEVARRRCRLRVGAPIGLREELVDPTVLREDGFEGSYVGRASPARRGRRRRDGEGEGGEGAEEKAPLR